MDALRGVIRHADGRAPRTGLQQMLLRHLGVEQVEELVQWTAVATKADVAALALVVAQASHDGDAVAGEILAHAADELEGHVLAILQILGPWENPPRVALAGGLLGPGRALREPLVTRLGGHLLPVLERPLDAAVGAARLALQSLD
jgi:N-acetylglucosamine kinase-like BadF-type ATPase